MILDFSSYFYLLFELSFVECVVCVVCPIAGCLKCYVELSANIKMKTRIRAKLHEKRFYSSDVFEEEEEEEEGEGGKRKRD